MKPNASQHDDRGATYAEELDRINERRQRVFGATLSDDKRPWGLALSGGGIRSATFALGVVQSLARRRAGSGTKSTDDAHSRLLARFDYLSTVSGGGYVGAFVGALFRPADTRGTTGKAIENNAAAGECSKAAYRCLECDPPGRMPDDRGGPTDTPDLPLRWLRDNGRYMAPAGAGDLFYAAALQARNWCALHYVIGVSLLAVCLLWLTARAALQTESAALHWNQFAALETLLQPASLKGIWWSPLLWPALAVAALLVMPFGISYWLTYRKHKKESLPAEFATHPVTASLALAICTAVGSWTATGTSAAPFLLWATISIALGILFYVFSGGARVELALLRSRLTRGLASTLRACLILLAAAVVETLSQSVYLLLHSAEQSPAPTLASMAAAAAAAAAGIRKLATFASGGGSTGILSKLSSSVLLAPLAVLFVLVVAFVWHLAAMALFYAGTAPVVAGPESLMITDADCNRGLQCAQLFTLTAAVGAAAAGFFVGFVNLSSLATLYSARLTRAYLGASNGERFRAGGSDRLHGVSDPHGKDDFHMTRYHDRLHNGPLHLINVTVNSTSGPGAQLTQLDRKGVPMAVTPVGLSVQGAKALPFASASNLEARGPATRMSAAGANPAGTSQPPDETGEGLSLGQWIAVSGAAFSPGVGRGTSVSMATLCTLANVRLGYWWDRCVSQNESWPWLRALVRNQRYLLREMAGRFHGTQGRFWYLSDGGHFENTAVYELLRRRCALIVACDDGADPDYTFEDLANLMRLARIDFAAEFTCLQPRAAVAALRDAGLPLEWNAESCLADSPRQLTATRGAGTQFAIAYEIRYGPHPDESTLLLIIKPRLTADAPLDLVQYQATHAAFPQESTLDQFFDEAQWESYRKLGVLSADRLFGPAASA